MYDKQGLFQAANGGTLLLDEVADLPLATQVKLLRVLQEKAVRPVGGESEISIDVRLMSATHKQLSREVASGAFRDDLFYRIKVIDIEVPALKNRRDDIPVLARYLLDKVAAENDAGEKTLSDAAMQRLTAADYPGNVRQLENILARAAAMAEGSTIEADDLEIDGSASLTPPSDVSIIARPETTDTDFRALTSLAAVDGNLEQHMDKIEREILQHAMTEYRWNKTAAAKGLGVSFRSLRYRLKKLGLDD
jgi:two-component system response regulator PilR (NtrC family)